MPIADIHLEASDSPNVKLFVSEGGRGGNPNGRYISYSSRNLW